jgi:hypothetical protein
MSSALEKDCLILNAHWCPINVVSVRHALSMLCAGEISALDFSDENYFVPVEWEKWVTLGINEGDDYVTTSHALIRAPRVMIAKNFKKQVLKRPKLSLKTLRERDNNKCAYTLKTLKPDECTMEHVQPRSKGGETVWENVVLADKRVNNKRGNKTLDEAGLTLKQKPYTPKPRPFVDSLQNRIKFPEWEPFVFKK